MHLQNIPEPVDHANALITAISEIGFSHYRIGKLDSALDILSQGIILCERAEIPTGKSLNLRLNQAKLQAVAIFMNNATPQNALQTLNDIRHMTPDDTVLARTDDLTGLVHYYSQLRRQEADYAQAESFLDRVATYNIELPIEWHSEWLFHKGLIYQNTERIDKARLSFEASMELASSENLFEIQSFAIRHLGFIQQYVDHDLDAARTSFTTSLNLRLSIDLKIYLPFSYQTLGGVCAAQGDVHTAEQYFENARSTALELDNVRALALSLAALGDLRRDQSQMADARECYEEALVAAQKIDFSALIAQLHTRIATLD